MTDSQRGGSDEDRTNVPGAHDHDARDFNDSERTPESNSGVPGIGVVSGRSQVADALDVVHAARLYRETYGGGDN
jgi:hypothetical protein